MHSTVMLLLQMFIIQNFCVQYATKIFTQKLYTIVLYNVYMIVLYHNDIIIIEYLQFDCKQNVVLTLYKCYTTKYYNTVTEVVFQLYII